MTASECYTESAFLIDAKCQCFRVLALCFTLKVL
nr:MAG TPA: Immunoglobulin J chain [Caudoviricetes sp.]